MSVAAAGSAGWPGFLRGFVEFAFADGVVTDEELRQFHEFADSLGVSAQEREPMGSRLQRGAVFSRIRAGDLPRVTHPDIYLDADETCFLDVGALRIRPLKTVTKVHEGRLLASSKKLRFIGFDHGWELAWQKVFNVAPQSEHDLYLQTSQAKSTGFYRVNDAEYAGVIVDTVARIQRREILVGAPGQRDSTSIPQHVKTEVWKRAIGGRASNAGRAPTSNSITSFREARAGPLPLEICSCCVAPAISVRATESSFTGGGGRGRPGGLIRRFGGRWW